MSEIHVGDIVQYVGEEYREQVAEAWNSPKTGVVRQIVPVSHWNDTYAVINSGGYTNTYYLSELRVIILPEHYGTWRTPAGDMMNIKDMTRSQLKKAIKEIEHNPGHSQAMKIISLKKTLEKV